MRTGKIMSRIFTFGCSCTFGQALQDCAILEGGKVHPGQQPSKLGWPTMLSTHYGKELFNLGKPGASNKEIAHRADLTRFKEGDIALFAWTYPERHCIFKKGSHNSYEDGVIYTISPWHETKQKQNYYKYIQNHFDDNIVLSWLYNYMHLKLDKVKAKSIHFRAIRGKAIPMKFDEDMVYADWNMFDFLCDRALDEAHPGPETNRRFADSIIKTYDYMLR